MTLNKENKDINFWVVIPARLKSTRFPEKMLANILGKSMIGRVVEKAISSGASRVIVATDSEKIKSAISSYNAECIMTSEDHPTGSDRICEALEKAGADSNQVVVNLQGDEVLAASEVGVENFTTHEVRGPAGAAPQTRCERSECTVKGLAEGLSEFEFNHLNGRYKVRAHTG